MITWEDKHRNSECPLFPPSPDCIAEHNISWHGISLWSVTSAVPAVSPPSFLCTPSLLSGTRNGKGLDTV